jgi:hypothetical protein
MGFDKQVKRLLRIAELHGARLRLGSKNHIIVLCPNGNTFAVSYSPRSRSNQQVFVARDMRKNNLLV